ncbi:hypothetical protein ACJJTC_017686 [Scirpophaga incertulas]
MRLCLQEMSLNHIFLIFLITGVQNVLSTFDVELKEPVKMQQGLGWPHQLTVVEGHEALMKLTTLVPNQRSCLVTTPLGKSFDVASPPSNRYELWGTGCGLRVRRVQTSDYGRWRLTSSAENSSMTGWIEVYVEGDTRTLEAPPISLMDGQLHAGVDLTSLDSEYCVVAQPFSQSVLIPGHCQVVLDKATRAVQGNWDILMGLPGRVNELQLDRRVIVEAERLDVGFIHDSDANKLHLYCNILHTNKNITFCRFQKTTEALGYNIMEGLSDGVHSYYGNGFVAKQCGMTIESPKAEDFSTWRCSVGSQQWVGDKLEKQLPMQALINVQSVTKMKRELRQSEQENRTIFVQEDRSFTITCTADISLSYCWFLHPNGTQFSPTPLQSDDQLFWYMGESLQTGDCGITFTHAHESDAGNWVCHMGGRDQLGVELSETIEVRVTGPLAAIKKEIDVVLGENTTIDCHTANGNRPLDYCRFLSPNFVGINLDDSITEDKAIIGKYYFTPGKFMNHGDCSLTIFGVQDEDIGVWTCAALINTDVLESSDTATLFIDLQHAGANAKPLTTASIIGMVAGIAFLFVVLGGVIWYRYGKSIPRIHWPRRNINIESNRLGNPYDFVSYSTSQRTSVKSNDSTDSGSDIVEAGTSQPKEATNNQIAVTT